MPLSQQTRCENCLSNKKSFYVYLRCTHFYCLSCCLCLADFERMTLRCCYRNTEMSPQLCEVLKEQVFKAKHNEIETTKVESYSPYKKCTEDIIFQKPSLNVVQPSKLNRLQKIQSLYLNDEFLNGLEAKNPPSFGKINNQPLRTKNGSNLSITGNNFDRGVTMGDQNRPNPMWKNHDTLNDRVLAKLKYNELKMDEQMQRHY